MGLDEHKNLVEILGNFIKKEVSATFLFGPLTENLTVVLF